MFLDHEPSLADAVADVAVAAARGEDLELAINRLRSFSQVEREPEQIERLKLKSGDPILITTRYPDVYGSEAYLNEGWAPPENHDQSHGNDFLFGSLQHYVGTTNHEQGPKVPPRFGVRLNLAKPLRIHTQDKLVTNYKAVLRPGDTARCLTPYTNVNYSLVPVNEGYTIASGQERVTDALATFGLSLSHLVQLQEHVYESFSFIH